MKTKNLNGNFNVVGLNIKKYRELNKIFLEKVTEVDFDKEVDTSNFDLQKFI